jgi:histidine ammonia-lyase
VVLDDGRVESNGNFHGAPLAFVLDFLAIAAADVASMSERRTDRLLDRHRSRGLPAFLADDPGVDSGHMIAQYTQAGIVSEMKRLAVPASVDSIIDNPVVLLGQDRVESNGNFHGAPVAYVLDFAAIVAADVASISERRTDRFLDKARSHGLPPFLADDPGVDSGHMIAQYTQAAIVSEMKRLANPASVDSIPSSAMQEDHVSMGWSAARKLRRSVDGLARVVAIEVLTAARALDLRRPLEPAPATEAVIRLLRSSGVQGPGPDRHLSPEIETTVGLVSSGAVLHAVEEEIGELQ